MTPLQSLLKRMATFMEEHGQPWALIGGLAVSVRTEPRFTRDLDLAIAVRDDAAAEALIRRVHGAGYRVLATVEQEATHRLATARLASREHNGLLLDLLFASSGIEAEICASAECVEVFPAVRIPVATLPHLMALKVLARDDQTRPQDAADLRQLIVAAEARDLTEAIQAAHLIEQRGYHRGRNLTEALQAAWRDFRA